jgi:Zn-finger nucleic acid-binding protein
MPQATRVTKHPPVEPPTLDCPKCRKSMVNVRSFLSGVRRIEQWDRDHCPRCRGLYEYRQRTGKVRPADDVGRTRGATIAPL